MTDLTSEKEFLAALISPHAGRSAPGAGTREAAVWALVDAIGLGLGTYDHPALVPGFRYAEPLGAGPATVWATGEAASVSSATLLNGISVRCYDYNDVLKGTSGQGGHPGDALPGLVAAAEESGAAGTALIDAIIATLDTSRALFDAVEITSKGWDYTNLTGLATIVGLGRLREIPHDTVAQALGIYAASRLGTNQYESGGLDQEGNFPSWKRLNGAETTLAARRALELAEAGFEGPFEAFLGAEGFIVQHGLDPRTVLDALAESGRPRGVEADEYKVWPVGTMAHAPILAALELRERLSGEHPEKVVLHVDHAVVHHLVRDEAWRVYSRETADHSLPYIVACVLAEGELVIEQFNGERAFDRRVVRDLMSRIEVHGRDATIVDGRSRLATTMQVTRSDGSALEAQAEADPAALSVPGVVPDLRAKFLGLVGRRHSVPYAEELLTAVLAVDAASGVSALTSVLRSSSSARG